MTTVTPETEPETPKPLMNLAMRALDKERDKQEATKADREARTAAQKENIITALGKHWAEFKPFAEFSVSDNAMIYCNIRVPRLPDITAYNSNDDVKMSIQNGSSVVFRHGVFDETALSEFLLAAKRAFMNTEKQGREKAFQQIVRALQNGQARDEAQAVEMMRQMTEIFPGDPRIDAEMERWRDWIKRIAHDAAQLEESARAKKHETDQYRDALRAFFRATADAVSENRRKLCALPETQNLLLTVYTLHYGVMGEDEEGNRCAEEREAMTLQGEPDADGFFDTYNPLGYRKRSRFFGLTRIDCEEKLFRYTFYTRFVRVPETATVVYYGLDETREEMQARINALGLTPRPRWPESALVPYERDPIRKDIMEEETAYVETRGLTWDDIYLD